MGATDAKSAKKSSTTNKTANAAVVAAAGKHGKTAKSPLKAAVEKLAKTIERELQPTKSAASKKKTVASAAKKSDTATAKTSATPPVRSTISPPKSPAMATVKSGAANKSELSAPGKTTDAPAKPATKVKAAVPVKNNVAKAKKAAIKNPQIDSLVAKTDTRMSVSKATANFVDNIQESVVSKVTEVATKTMKPTSVVPENGTLLTEEQILKMNDKDYMNEAQLAFFKARLQQLERDLLKNAGETTEHLRETVLVPDPADRATIEEEHALELRTRDRERKLLKKVQQSLASIESGEYGWCEETGEPIGVPRLLARPTATLSLEAQQRRELKQKLYGD